MFTLLLARNNAVFAIETAHIHCSNSVFPMNVTVYLMEFASIPNIPASLFGNQAVLLELNMECFNKADNSGLLQIISPDLLGKVAACNTPKLEALVRNFHIFTNQQYALSA